MRVYGSASMMGSYLVEQMGRNSGGEKDDQRVETMVVKMANLLVWILVD